MADFTDFRTQARNAFPDLIISVMMYEEGSGRGGELTMYRIKAAGMAIGADPLTATGTSAAQAIANLIRQVAPARRQLQKSMARPA